MKLLVIEDNAKMAELLHRGLTENGHVVSVCSHGADGQRFAETGAFDAIVLDVGLPDRDGMRVCEELRQRGIATPVLMLTAMSGTANKVKGFSAGADDYLTKPFDFDELMARLKALHRRHNPAVSAVIKHADLQVDLARRTAKRGGRSLKLSRREFDLLVVLVRNPHRVLSREVIGSAVWNQTYDSRSNVVDVYVCALRRKVNQEGERTLIQTVVNSGYVLDNEPNDAESTQE